MGLKPMAPDRRLAIIAHRNGQEVELDIGIVDASARPHKATAFELVRGPRTGPREKPARADVGFADKAPVFVQADRLARGHLDVNLEVVLQVRADARPVGDNLDPQVVQVARRADT